MSRCQSKTLHGCPTAISNLICLKPSSWYSPHKHISPTVSPILFNYNAILLFVQAKNLQITLDSSSVSHIQLLVHQQIYQPFLQNLCRILLLTTHTATAQVYATIISYLDRSYYTCTHSGLCYRRETPNWQNLNLLLRTVSLLVVALERDINFTGLLLQETLYLSSKVIHYIAMLFNFFKAKQVILFYIAVKY